ncbi:aminotransferase class I/II-fold pyridoxal phosphate-dependent enzyme [Gordonia sp. ABSL1-1]|uniref:pyridoxal phosphate-dependent aminotransferase n=1 Tax=Gordonia sp. ABSL1-1 TaxID=3053923 RepID=UPI0025725DF2|nr:aminotransferase class I/II-fold pyridoxal phosphate-dependent enzyme [Gordonia sp. ABSL1-1]MDL9937984.1 aminotransferase class I/II-fold pyridoxal phosphate-dependent enzyme [Gordonia sp. ABSL1-1]
MTLLVPPQAVTPSRTRDRRIRLDLNESPFGPLPAVEDALASDISRVNRYPDFLPDRLREMIAAHLGLPAHWLSIGAGATGVAGMILSEARRRARARGVEVPELATAIPTFDGYPILAGMLRMGVAEVALTPAGGVDLDGLARSVGPDTAAVVLCSPHNPTGAVIADVELRDFLDDVPPSVPVLFDEAYREFCDDPIDVVALLRRHRNLIAIRTFSKAYGLAALRVGYAIADPVIAAALRTWEIPFGIAPAATAAVPVALAARAELDERVKAIRAERDRLARRLTEIGSPPLPGQGNFVFLPGDDGLQVGRLLASVGVIGKRCGKYGLRLTVGDAESTDTLIDALRLTAWTA